jgi:hypothetical protein
VPVLPDLDGLAARAAGLADEYDRRRAEAEAAVVRWDWYSWPGLDPWPCTS